VNLTQLRFGFLSIIVMFASGCATGTAIVTGNARAAIAPEQVRIYLQAPADFEVIGIVNASSDAGLTEQGSVDYAIDELKKQAAKIGANGVLLESTGEKTTSTLISVSPGNLLAVPIKAKTVQGKAIFVRRR
jgi:hypothetical protein